MIILEHHHGWLNPKTIAKITKKYGLPQISNEKFRMKILKDINRKRGCIKIKFYDASSFLLQ